MADKFTQLSCWAFAWAKPWGSNHITRIAAYTRSELIRAVEKDLGLPWRKVRGMGGRAIRVVIAEATHD